MVASTGLSAGVLTLKSCGASPSSGWTFFRPSPARAPPPSLGTFPNTSKGYYYVLSGALGKMGRGSRGFVICKWGKDRGRGGGAGGVWALRR